ncbi:hypothetical protein [Amycolatopsis xylanica]|nr:hypothetical protein [Amycolatopsis xylanica]
MKRRPTTYLALGSVLLLAAAGCGQAKAGTALPKGEDATAYVNAKFAGAMDKLDASLDRPNTKTSHDAYIRLDDKWLHNIITASRQGSPESRVSRNRSEKNPDESLDTFIPAEGQVEYMHLGPVYKSLAPTAWVSMPKPANLGPLCAYSGVITACKMADTITRSVRADKRAVKGARSTPDGKTEVSVDVTLDAFLTSRVEVLPPSALDMIGPELRKQIIPTKFVVDADGKLSTISMEAKFEGGGHKMELKYDFRFLGPASPQDFPKIPDPADVTVLPDDAAVDDFYKRLGEVQGG